VRREQTSPLFSMSESPMAYEAAMMNRVAPLAARLLIVKVYRADTDLHEHVTGASHITIPERGFVRAP
jgi:hypothetical protein